MIITLIHALFNRETEFFAYIFFLIFSNISAAFVLLFRQDSAVQNICSEVQVTCKKQPRDIRQHQNTRNFIKFEKTACHYNHGDEQHHKQNERRKAKIKREKQRRPEHIQNELNEVNAERTRRLRWASVPGLVFAALNIAVGLRSYGLMDLFRQGMDLFCQ